MAVPISATPPPRSYRRFLTSSLHSRFVHAVLGSLVLGLINAFLLNPRKDLLWSWFPLGPTGIKACFFTLTSLCIFSLQIATLDVGNRTSPSPFTTFRRSVLSTNTAHTLLWYCLSALCFSETYIFCSPDLRLVSTGSHTTPDMLNERLIFFRAYTQMLALVASVTHVYYGRSSIRLPVSKPPPTTSAEHTDPNTHPLKPRITQLRQTLTSILLRSLRDAGLLLVASPFIYSLLLRRFLWKGHLAFGKILYDLSRKNAHPSGYPPLGIPYLFKSYIAGVLLLITWELSAALFLVYLNQEPTNRGLPLSASSKDPNGTLLSGLKAKSPVVKTFAFWELVIIAQKHKDRRQAIFEDIERMTGPIWPQMLHAGLIVLQNIDLRITGPAAAPTMTLEPEIKSLPKIVAPPSTRSIAAQKPKPTLGQSITETLAQIGNGQNAWHPSVDNWQKTKALGPQIRDMVNPPLPGSASWIYKSSDADRINAVVLGSPSGNAALIVDVIESITKMLVASLSEDTYGKATPTVPDTVRAFTRTLTLIESVIEKNNKAAPESIQEVAIIVERLRGGLRELLAAFQLYLLDVGLGITELNLAKKAVEEPRSGNLQQPTQREAKPREGGRGQTTSTRHIPQSSAAQSRDLPRTSNGSRRPLTGPAHGRLFPRSEMEQVR